MKIMKLSEIVCNKTNISTGRNTSRKPNCFRNRPFMELYFCSACVV